MKTLLNVCCLVLLCVTASAKPPQPYRFSELGFIYPLAINKAGDIVGHEGRPFVYREGTLSYIPLGGEAVAINASGDILIRSAHDSEWRLRAFVWTGGAALPLPVENLVTRGEGINNDGLVVGGAGELDPDQPWTAVLWTNYCCYQILGTLGEGYSSHAFDVNKRGQAVGASWPTISTPGLPRMNRPVMFQNGYVEDLGLPQGAIAGMAIAINDHAEVVVNCVMTDYRARVFVYSSGEFTDLGLLPNQLNTEARAINNSGDIVGFGQVGNGQRAFLYTNGQMHDLNDLTDLPAGIVLDAAMGINDRGEIVGIFWSDSFFHGFLLTPQGKTGQ